jgi:adenylosuccinate synthase
MSAIIVTDLSYGDAGKGTTVDYLVRQAQSSAVIRYNGGAQAAHNVITPDGRHHTFAQFGSGSFVSGVQTYLSRFMLVNPLNMFPEAEHLGMLGVRDIWQRTAVDRDAMIVTPWHIAANRLRERARGDGRHGSCGQGIGEAMADSIDRPDLTIRVRDIETKLADKLQQLRAYKLAQLRRAVTAVPFNDDWKLLTDEAFVDVIVAAYQDWARRVRIVDTSYLSQLAQQTEQLVFEGAQGVLLDEWFGFHPYTTWSTTTPANALQLLQDVGYNDTITKLGVLRAYTTRHGPGPFVTEDPLLGRRIPEQHNGTGMWQGAFRYGHLDLVAHRYACDVAGGIDELVVTGLDRQTSWQYCLGYQAPMVCDRDTFFVFDDQGFVRSIKLGVRDDLEYQARLSDLLLSCRPVYQPTAVDGDHLLAAIAGTLAVPVGIASYGPSATDKRVAVVC